MSKPFLPPPWDGLKRDDADKSASQFVQPAFPVLEQGSNGLECSNPGMSLRDWFAGLAMSGALANTQPKEMPKGGYAEWIEGVARESYAYADAMMEARK